MDQKKISFFSLIQLISSFNSVPTCLKYSTMIHCRFLMIERCRSNQGNIGISDREASLLSFAYRTSGLTQA